MHKNTLILGFGPTGRAIAARLVASGRQVTVAQRKHPQALPHGVEFLPLDAGDAGVLKTAMQGRDEVVLAIGLPYDSRIWQALWPRIMTNVLDGAEASGARVLFIDNLYGYGPQDAPLSESMPLSDRKMKPAIRAGITRQWLERRQNVRFVALRAPDFYGPCVDNSHFGGFSLGAMTKGKTAFVMMKPDEPHDIAYVPDMARAAEMLLDAGEDVERQAWHMPCAPTLTPRQFFAQAATILGQPLKLRTLPPVLLPLAGLFSPLLREASDMRFTFDRRYQVDASKFLSRFGFTPTPFAEGLRQTLT